MYKIRKCNFCQQRPNHDGSCGCQPYKSDPTPEQLAAIVGEPPTDDTFGDDERDIERRLHAPECFCNPLAGIVCDGCVLPSDDELFLKHYSVPDGLTEPRRFGRIAEAITESSLHRKGNHISDR